jgi:hypothetical protein
MSEYQRYDFVLLDRPITAKEMGDHAVDARRALQRPIGRLG